MRGSLIPLEDESPTLDANRKAFALLDRNRLGALARVMPDAQSAALLCIVWDACRRERLEHGPYAGQFVARLSGQDLVEMTKRPLRTVRYALSRLRQASLIKREQHAPGRKAVYRVDLI